MMQSRLSTTITKAILFGSMSGLSLAALAWASSCTDDLGATNGQSFIRYDDASNGCSIRADKVCDIVGGEDCNSCVDCTNTAYCIQQNPGAGIDCAASNQQDGVCDPIADYCVCNDCSKDPYCQNPAAANCNHDGQCQGYLEGCLCDDCIDAGTCMQNRMKYCKDDAGISNACDDDESCDCIDCLWTTRCACVDDGSCAPQEPCICNDCATDPACTGEGCNGDCSCDLFNETCACLDCAKECELDAGIGGAGGGCDDGGLQGGGGTGGTGGNG